MSEVRQLPAGTVTLLLTDIEGSTALLRQLGERYAGLLETVRTLLRTAVEQAGGHEVDARADELFAVFEAPPAALDAAVAIQRALARQACTGLTNGGPTGPTALLEVILELP